MGNAIAALASLLNVSFHQQTRAEASSHFRLGPGTSQNEVIVAVLKRRSKMISFRLSEQEYADLRNVCENAGARSVSDLARDAVHRLVCKQSESAVEATVQELVGRVNSLDLEVRRLAQALDGPVAKDMV